MIGNTGDPQGRVETQTLVRITISPEPEVITKPPKIRKVSVVVS